MKMVAVTTAYSNEQLDQVTDAVKRGVGWFMRRGMAFLSREDMEQEGYRVALTALSTYDAAVGSELNAYLFCAVRRSLGNYVSQQVTIASIGSDWHAGREAKATSAMPELPTSRNAEDRLVADHLRSLADNWHARVRRVLASAVLQADSTLTQEDRARAAELLVEEHTPTAVAALTGLDLAAVRKFSTQFRKRVTSSYGLLRLHNEAMENFPDGIETLEKYSSTQTDYSTLAECLS